MKSSFSVLSADPAAKKTIMLGSRQTTGRRDTHINSVTAVRLRSANSLSCGYQPDRSAKETAVTVEITDPAANHLLAALSRADFTELKALLKQVTLEQGVVLQEPGEEVEQIYFPHDGMVSLLAVMKDGRAIETATVGAEGVVGVMAGIGLHIALTRAVVQLPLVASKISATGFRKAVQSSNTLRNLVVRANDALLAQVQITAACNALHTIEARLARWILQSSDRSRSAALPLTQELLSQMLGVTRSSVSEVAGRLQAAGLIRYVRGNIEIVDRRALEKSACECYGTLRQASILI